MQVRARKGVLESGDWLTAANIAQLADLSARNPSAQPNKWKKQGLIFAINHGGVDYFPAYGLDRDAGFSPTTASQSYPVFPFGSDDGWQASAGADDAKNTPTQKRKKPAA